MKRAEERNALWHERLQAQSASGLNIAAWRKRLTASPKPAATLIAVPLAGISQERALELQTPDGYVLRLSCAEPVNWLPTILSAVR